MSDFTEDMLTILVADDPRYKRLYPDIAPLTIKQKEEVLCGKYMPKTRCLYETTAFLLKARLEDFSYLVPFFEDAKPKYYMLQQLWQSTDLAALLLQHSVDREKIVGALVKFQGEDDKKWLLATIQEVSHRAQAMTFMQKLAYLAEHPAFRSCIKALAAACAITNACGVSLLEIAGGAGYVAVQIIRLFPATELAAYIGETVLTLKNANCLQLMWQHARLLGKEIVNLGKILQSPGVLKVLGTYGLSIGVTCLWVAAVINITCCVRMHNLANEVAGVLKLQKDDLEKCKKVLIELQSKNDLTSPEYIERIPEIFGKLYQLEQDLQKIAVTIQEVINKLQEAMQTAKRTAIISGVAAVAGGAICFIPGVGLLGKIGAGVAGGIGAVTCVYSLVYYIKYFPEQLSLAQTIQKETKQLQGEVAKLIAELNTFREQALGTKDKMNDILAAAGAACGKIAAST